MLRKILSAACYIDIDLCVYILDRTLEERAQRLFSTKGKSLESLDPSLFAKNPKAKGPKK